MAKLQIFAILILAFATVSLNARRIKDCDGIQCQEFCCDPGQLCCYDTMSGTYYCDKKCDLKTQLRTSKAKVRSKDCDGIKCQEFCCETGQLCCYDTMSGTYYCDKKCGF